MHDELLIKSNVHESWYPILKEALKSVDKLYLDNLMIDQTWLPGNKKMFSAFKLPLDNTRWLLFGESPYPQPKNEPKQRSCGVSFLDDRVKSLWSDKGLSKEVNKATSLRNMIKSMLIASGHLTSDNTSQTAISNLDKATFVTDIHGLFKRLNDEGVLCLNATPVLHPERKPQKEAKHWDNFNKVLLENIFKYNKSTLPTLILWGKIAEQILAYEITCKYNTVQSEHPYNISFINNPVSINLFKELSPLEQL